MTTTKLIIISIAGFLFGWFMAAEVWGQVPSTTTTIPPSIVTCDKYLPPKGEVKDIMVGENGISIVLKSGSELVFMRATLDTLGKQLEVNPNGHCMVEGVLFNIYYFEPKV